jgi:hypothetical protein
MMAAQPHWRHAPAWIYIYNLHNSILSVCYLLSRRNNVQKWEYTMVHARYESVKPHLRILVNTIEIEWTPQTLYGFLNHLGDQGWELISFTLHQKGYQYEMIFKRPKVEDNIS